MRKQAIPARKRRARGWQRGGRYPARRRTKAWARDRTRGPLRDGADSCSRPWSADRGGQGSPQRRPGTRVRRQASAGSERGERIVPPEPAPPGDAPRHWSRHRLRRVAQDAQGPPALWTSLLPRDPRCGTGRGKTPSPDRRARRKPVGCAASTPYLRRRSGSAPAA